jgi:hypothetical protein
VRCAALRPDIGARGTRQGRNWHRLRAVWALDPLARSLNLKTTTGKSNGELTLATLHCADGVANGGSSPDCYLIREVVLVDGSTQELPGAFWEVKHSSDSSTNALTQAFSQACNASLAMVRLGVCSKDVRIPLVSSNGREIMFADVVLLEPAFPMLVPLTKVLDLCDPTDRDSAARWLCRLQSFSVALRATNDPQPALHTGISPDTYHFKLLDDVFWTRLTLDASLRHLFTRLNHLWTSPDTHRYVLPPLTIRTKKRRRQGALVFRNLSQHRIGLPSGSKAERQSLVAEIRNAIEACHSAGVVHLDFYPSNVMWLCKDGVYDVKIIDWDACHLIGERIRDETRSRLEDKGRFPEDGLAHTGLDLEYLELLEQHVDDVSQTLAFLSSQYMLDLSTCIMSCDRITFSQRTRATWMGHSSRSALRVYLETYASHVTLIFSSDLL